jgi:mRNA interferase MazF
MLVGDDVGMERGELWMVMLDEPRPVVLLSADHSTSTWRAIQVVPPAGTDITGVAIEVVLNGAAGLVDTGVVRVALPQPGLVPCTWLVTVMATDVVTRLGVVDAATLREIDDALAIAGLVPR